MPKNKRALISVGDKTNLEALLKSLSGFGYEIVSTGGTAKFIRDQGYDVIEVSEITNFEEILDGRVKTLHPKIHAAILADRSKPEHLKTLDRHSIDSIDIVIVNLYPFAKTISKPDCTLDDAIENIDIGGPSMIRSAAKNFMHITVVSDPSQYEALIQDLQDNQGKTSIDLRKKFAKLAFEKTSKYDEMIFDYLNSNKAQDIDSTKKISKNNSFIIPEFTFKQNLRYGENPHQKAALFTNGENNFGLANAKQLQGKELSFNNYMDLDAAWSIVSEFDKSLPCVSIIKHTNPCGVAIAPNVTLAFREAFLCDTTSAFGGIVASNQIVDLDAANEMTQIFLEAIVAPGFTDDALKIFATKSNLRLLEIKIPNQEPSKKQIDIKTISGGFLIQDRDDLLLDPSSLKTVTKKQVSEQDWIDLLFAWKIVKHVKSNAIVAAKDGRTIGIGVGQTNRVAAVEIALKQSDMDTRGCVLASDAFFPFKDSIEIAARNHVSAIIQPGGSKRDDEVIKACDELGIAMVFTNYRHFKH